ncbi:uncharacterized protein KD926_002351 [Aspergillus affinis]|uniref:uncharacterized protein n=1 Tax=Aspergillus affinis TaxID=1070780 RepID=UPI0022FE6F61|nr:uncharacterized protein KD926_002351 [Aspergillus affinis]KAI9043972.1 hypothetical protein KD926_002351 [Aspergillus affinis]
MMPSHFVPGSPATGIRKSANPAILFCFSLHVCCQEDVLAIKRSILVGADAVEVDMEVVVEEIGFYKDVGKSGPIVY